MSNESKMTFFDASLKVLREAGGGPLHYREIARLAIESGYISSSGRTPEATIGAILYTHIKKAEAADQEPKVSQVGRGQFVLSTKVKRGPLKVLEEMNENVRSELSERIANFHPQAFENFIGALLSNIGFENVVVLKYSGDGGLDVEAELTVGGVTNVKTAVQVKRWKNNVPGKIVRELRGGLKTDQRGLIITTSSFTKDAKREAIEEAKTPISLIDGEKLLDLLIENEVGISKKKITYLELDLEMLEEFEEESEISLKGKRLGFWLLPGGAENYVQSTQKMLKYVAQNEPAQDQMIEWMPSEFPKAQSEKTIVTYIRVLTTLGLLTFDGEVIKITDDGAEVLTKNAKEKILSQLCLRVAGIEEYLDRLKDRPITLKESHEFFKKALGVDWETDYQTKIRLQWLENVDAIKKVDNNYMLAQ